MMGWIALLFLEKYLSEVKAAPLELQFNTYQYYFSAVAPSVTASRSLSVGLQFCWV
jgi:hypothetical protein